MLEYFCKIGDFMQHANTNNLYNQIENLIQEIYNNYQKLLKDQKFEKIEYPYIPTDEIAEFVETFDKNFTYLESNILEDILNINLEKAVLGNIYQNLKQKLYSRIITYSGNYFCASLINALREQYYLVQQIEKTIRETFIGMLEETINSCNGKFLKEELKRHLTVILCKYAINEKDLIQYEKNAQIIIAQNISSQAISIFNSFYIDSLIKRSIDTLLSMPDDILISDKEYAKAICIQLLLRSIFMIIDDYQKLIPYEEYYNKKASEETTTKKMIREAFILHYNDSKNDKLKTLVKNKIIDL